MNKEIQGDTSRVLASWIYQDRYDIYLAKESLHSKNLFSEFIVCFLA